VSKETEMAKFKDDDEIQPETPDPRSPAEQRGANEEALAEYVDTHEKAAKQTRSDDSEWHNSGQ
jgi:hypothetical protein